MFKNEVHHPEVVYFVRRAPGLSNLEVETYSRRRWPLHASTQQSLGRLEFPLLWNLTKLVLDFASMRTLNGLALIETFLVTLEDCLDLESLRLASAGPDLPDGDRDDREVTI